MSILLSTEHLTMQFGGVVAVDDLNIKIPTGEITALIGPNGAGKTTAFNVITGGYQPTNGRVVFDGAVIAENCPRSKMKRIYNGTYSEPYRETVVNKPDVITRMGLARTFQNIRLFQNMTVLENVMIGRHPRLKAGILGAVVRDKTTREEEEKVVYDSYEILKKIELDKYVNEVAKNLPYGAQRLLEIARALATNPFLLLLDEPAAGMNPIETNHLNDLIIRLRDALGITIFLIEHDMNLVMSLSERIYVMDYGQLIATGTPDEIKHNPLVIKAYLGEEVNA